MSFQRVYLNPNEVMPPLFLKEEVERLKTPIRQGQVSEKTLSDYCRKYLDLLSSEFVAQNQIKNLFARDRWQALNHTLTYEWGPWKKPKATGCSPVAYAYALKSYLTKYQPTDPIFFNLRDRLKVLLDNFLCTCIFIDILDVVPEKKYEDFQEYLKKKLLPKLIQHLKEHGELLLPLGWSFPDPYQKGHHMMVKIRYRKNKKSQLKIFDIAPKEGDEKICTLRPHSQIQKIYHGYRCPTSICINSSTSPSTVLNNLYQILPLQIPKTWESRIHENSREECNNLTKIAFKMNYAVLGMHGSFQKKASSFPSLDNFAYCPKDNCVPGSFRQLVYTMVKESAVKRKFDHPFTSSLRGLCEKFFLDFKVYASMHTGCVSS